MSRRSAPLTGASNGSAVVEARVGTEGPFTEAPGVRAAALRFELAFFRCGGRPAGCGLLRGPVRLGPASLREALPVGLAPLRLRPTGREAGVACLLVFLVALAVAFGGCAFFAMLPSLSDSGHYHGACYDPRLYLSWYGRGSTAKTR
jgi:hypothetical protein